MSLREYRLWAAFYDLDPWGPERIDLMLARVCAVLANCHSTKGGYSEADFLPQFGDGSRDAEFIEPSDELDERLRMMALKTNALMGGTISKRDGNGDFQTRSAPDG
jgi:hypothetical protein